MAKCRICNEEINKEKDDWVMPSKNYYYHRKCYEDWKQALPNSDEEYIDYIYDYIARDLKKSYDWYVCEAQRKKFNKDKMTNKGILFTLKYFYDVKHNDWDKGHGGIGIVPYVYQEACTYWIEQERKSKGIVAEIERQMKEATVIRPHTKRQSKKKKKFEVDLSAIGEMEDDE